MKPGNPLYFSSVTCPICGTENKFENIRKGGYTVSGTDTDFMPLGIKWDSEKSINVNPLLYFIATCSKCRYSVEFNDKFKEWQKDTHFRNYKQRPLKEAHLSHYKNEDGLIQTIGKVLNPEGFPNETTICKLILAIYNEKLNSHASSLAIGRFYLRIGWIFREMKGGVIQDGSSSIRLLKSLDNKLDTIDATLEQLDGSIRDLSSFYRDNMNTLFPEARGDTPDENTQGYFNLLNDIISTSDAVKGKIQQLKELNNNVDIAKTVKSETDAPKFSEYQDFNKFLQTLQDKWTEVPINEEEALEYSMKYYINSMEAGRAIKDGPQSIQAFYLIGELAKRVGDYNEAKRYLNTAINNGRAFMVDKSSIDTEIGRVKTIVDKAYTQVKQIMGEEKKIQAVTQ